MGHAAGQTMKKKARIPDTDSIEELARFWDTHDATDFEDEFEEVTEPLFERKRRTVMVVPLEPQEVEAVEKIAKAKGLDERTLLREWVLERIREF
jgi:CopG antitoxin of type II toxin-antitoxin system